MIEKNNKVIVLDARMINMSGIGRYIQALIPELIKKCPNLVLLGGVDQIKKFGWSEEVKIIEFSSPIYSVKEQFEFYIRVPPCNIFISPNYNVPIVLPQAKKIAVIIPDTNHLVFAKEFSILKKIYSKIFFAAAVKKDFIFTISEFSKSEIIKFTNCNKQKIIVAKCAIDKEYFKNMLEKLDVETIPNIIKKYKDENYILYIGNLKPHKNLKRALLAFNKLSKNLSSLKFLIVGKKDNFLNVDKEIFDLVSKNENLNNKVEFTGHISDVYLSFLYKNAKLFLFPSLYEGFGIPPLEAMFFGCPVLVSREGSLPEICGDAAHYCNAYSVDDIALSLNEMLSNQNLTKELMDKGYKKVDEYDWSIFNSTIINGLSL